LLTASLSFALAAPPRPDTRNDGIFLPQDRIVRIPSPDGRWTLAASRCSLKQCDDRTLSLEDTKTGRQLFVEEYNRDLAVGWSPDSRAFFLNDAWMSNEEHASIYWPGAWTPLVLDEYILRSDRKARRLNADHTYFRVRRWVDARTLIVEYCGHNSIYPSKQFDLFYRVQIGYAASPEVSVRFLSGHIRPVTLSNANDDECTP
jgi:hypothetical protein